MSSEPSTPQSDWTTEQLNVARELAGKANTLLMQDANQLDGISHLISEAKAVLDMVENQDLDSVLELRSQVLNEEGYFFQLQDRTEDALTKHREAADMCEELLNRGVAFRPNTAATLINVSTVLLRLERLDEALEAISRSTELISSFLEENPDQHESNYLGFGAYHTRAYIELKLERVEDADHSAEISYQAAEKIFDDHQRALQAAQTFMHIAYTMHQLEPESFERPLKWAQRAEKIVRIAFDHEKTEQAIAVFVETQLLLILLNEQKGSFDAAEDALFNAIEVLGNHPLLLARGREFYRTCLDQSDEKLEEGGLPREEVEEGLEEILSRIEAIGGTEVLEQTVQQLTGGNGIGPGAPNSTNS